jgi:uncharacterized protein YraI
MATVTRARLCSCPIILSLALALAASAQTAYTTQDVNVHAGPSKDYPLVAWLRPGTQVAVAGCLSTWTWCDVVVGPNRGWVYARYLAYPYQNQNVPIISGGASLGLPIVTFSIVPYWNSYYRGRPWYGNRPHWQYRPPPSVSPPSPPRPKPPPPGIRPPPQPKPPPSGTRPPPKPKPPSEGAPPPRPNPPSGGRPPPGTKPVPQPSPAQQQ